VGSEIETWVGKPSDDGGQKGTFHRHHDPGGSQGKPEEEDGLLGSFGDQESVPMMVDGVYPADWI
jgi:hypothetical protein